MRGGPFHEYMIDQLDTNAMNQGFLTKRSVPCRKGRNTGFIDLLIYNTEEEDVLLVEVEMSKRRALNDAIKRRDMGLWDKAKLWIVTPTFKLTQTILDELRCSEIGNKEPVSVLAFGAAMQRLKALKAIKFSVVTQ